MLAHWAFPSIAYLDEVDELMVYGPPESDVAKWHWTGQTLRELLELRHSEDRFASGQASAELRGRSDTRVAPQLIEMLNSEDPDDRLFAARLLSLMEIVDAEEPLARLLDDPDQAVRDQAGQGVRWISAARRKASVPATTETPDTFDTECAVRNTYWMPKEDRAELLAFHATCQAIANEPVSVQREQLGGFLIVPGDTPLDDEKAIIVAVQLMSAGVPEGCEHLKTMLRTQWWHRVLEVLATSPSPHAEDVVVTGLDSPYLFVRWRACEFFSQFGFEQESTRAALTELLDDPSWIIRIEAARALRE
jgi:hypothetical protein